MREKRQKIRGKINKGCISYLSADFLVPLREFRVSRFFFFPGTPFLASLDKQSGMIGFLSTKGGDEIFTLKTVEIVDRFTE